MVLSELSSATGWVSAMAAENMPRCPQGRPVLVQAGSSDTARRA